MKFSIVADVAVIRTIWRLRLYWLDIKLPGKYMVRLPKWYKFQKSQRREQTYSWVRFELYLYLYIHMWVEQWIRDFSNFPPPNWKNIIAAFINIHLSIDFHKSLRKLHHLVCVWYSLIANNCMKIENKLISCAQQTLLLRRNNIAQARSM